MCSLPVLEAGRCQRAGSFEAETEDLVQTSVLGLLTAVFSLCLSYHLPSTVVCVQISPFYKDTRHTGPGTKYELLLMNYTCSDPDTVPSELRGLRTSACETS